MTKWIPIVVLILVQYFLGAQARSVGQCWDNLVSSVRVGGNLCPTAEEYTRCIFEALDIQTSSISESQLTSLENGLEKTLTKNDMDCNIDIRAILKKGNEDERNAATHIAKTPTGYDGASKIGDCLNTFTEASNQAGGSTCPLVAPYSKCLIRLTGLYKYKPSNDVYTDLYSSMASQVETTLQSFHLFCNLDIKELSAEVAREQKYRN